MLRKVFENQKIWAGIYCIYLVILLVTILIDNYGLLEFQARVLIIFAIEAIIPFLLYKAFRFFIFANDKD